MRVVKLSILAAALTVALAAPGFALEGQAQTPPRPQTQTPAPKPPTPTQQPPATPPTAQPAAPKPAAPAPPVPFPQDAKYAVVDVQAIAQNSVAGKAASAKLNELNAKNSAAIQDKAKQLQGLQTKRDSSGVLNDAARANLDKDIEKLQRDIQYAQTSAQAEMNDLNTELQTDFQKKLIPIIEEIAKEKGLYLVFTADSGFAYINPGLNISDEVIKRLDAKKN
jgi:outer membrane protein